MSYGLRQSDVECILQAVSGFEEIESVVIFGSRAKGNSKTASDVDIAIKGKGVTSKTVAGLRTAIDEMPLPYFFDIVHYETISNQELIEHIDRVGEIMYQRTC